jgi:hypothetical protein
MDDVVRSGAFGAAADDDARLDGGGARGLPSRATTRRGRSIVVHDASIARTLRFPRSNGK